MCSLNDAEDNNHSLMMDFALRPVPILALNLHAGVTCDWGKDGNMALFDQGKNGTTIWVLQSWTQRGSDSGKRTDHTR